MTTDPAFPKVLTSGTAPLEQLLRHFVLPTHVTGIVYHSTAWADPPSRRERVARALERLARWVRGKA